MFYYNIFQLPVRNERCFMPVDYDEIDLMDYVHVWNFESETEQDLEKIYEQLNIDHPKGYCARSLSVSDVIVVRNENTREQKYYVVDICGFKEVKEIRT